MPEIGLIPITPTSVSSTGTGNSSAIEPDGSVSFTTCNTLSVDGVFSSSYENYMVVMRSVGSVAFTPFWVRFRVSGSDNSTANSYVNQFISVSSTSVSGDRQTADRGRVSTTSSTRRSGSTTYFYGPFLTSPTAWASRNMDSQSGAAILDIGGTHNQSTSYDGFTFVNDSTNTFSGLLTVFGFNQ